jgi:glycosyltransferase involved in cell wall biosynthesis
MKKLNVWFLSAYEQPKGPISRIFDYGQQLVRRGHRVTVFVNSYFHRTHVELLGPRERWRIEDVEGLRVVWLRTFHYADNGLRRGINMLSFARRALQAQRTLADAPDVVVGDSVPLSSGWAAARIARARGAALVFQVRDVWPIALVYDGGLSRHSPVYYAFRWVEKALYRESYRICATMPFLQDHVAESGSDPAKVTWVPNGVNLRNYHVVDPADGPADRPLTVMYAGAFGNAHDVITIVRAAHLLATRGVGPFQFVLVGDGVKRPECERLASSLGLGNVEFRNQVPKQDVPALQAGADVLVACVLDSRAYEFGINLNKIFDYFASGRPVVFSGRSPNDPVAESGCGFSIPPENPKAMADALARLRAMNRDQRIELGRRARSYAEIHFDVDVLADRMEAMLAEAATLRLA